MLPLVTDLSSYGIVEVLQPAVDAIRAAGATAPIVIQVLLLQFCTLHEDIVLQVMCPVQFASPVM